MERPLVAFLLIATTTMACMSEKGAADADTAGEPPSWSTDLQPIVARCAGCHLGGFASGGLSFDHGPADLVDVASRMGMPYVTPGHPDESYLFHKLAGTHEQVGGFGARMPLGLPLTDADLELVERWISAGARP